jgi:uncharacterized membrane protein
MSANEDRTKKGYWKMNDDEYYSVYRSASAAWYLLPIFFGIIGSLIMWLALRNEDPRKAKKGLILGIILTVAWTVIWFLLFAAIMAAIPTATTNPSIQYPAT